jgi:hypothetical protein
MNCSTTASAKKPAFGIGSLACSGIGGGFCVFTMMHLKDLAWDIAFAMAYNVNPAGVPSYGIGVRGFLIFMLLGTVSAIIGLARAEKPRWPATVGLLVCVIPFAGFLCLALLGG